MKSNFVAVYNHLMSDAPLPVQRRPFTVRRMLLMVALFAAACAFITNFHTGSRAIFLLGTAGTATLVGAALGVPFDRTVRAALCGAVLGVAFFLHAWIY